MILESYFNKALGEASKLYGEKKNLPKWVIFRIKLLNFYWRYLTWKEIKQGFITIRRIRHAKKYEKFIKGNMSKSEIQKFFPNSKIVSHRKNP